MCLKNMIKPKIPKGAIETKAPAQQAQTAKQERPDLEAGEEQSEKVKRKRSGRGKLRIDVNMGGGGRVSRGTNVPR